MFKIHMGVPEMKEFWASLKETVKTGKASKNDERMYKRSVPPLFPNLPLINLRTQGSDHLIALRYRLCIIPYLFRIKLR